MRYSEIKKKLKEDDGGAPSPAADAGVTSSSDIATMVTPIYTMTKKKKKKVAVIKRSDK